MRLILTLILAHIVAIAGLFWLGVVFNDQIANWSNDYQGGITVLSVAFGLYSFAVNALYQRSQTFYVWVNRLRLVFARTHTFWQPAFDFDLRLEQTIDPTGLLDRIADAIAASTVAECRRVANTPTMISVNVDNLMCFVIRLRENAVHVGLDRRLLVPSHLYDTYSKRLARLAESVCGEIRPASARYGMIVGFSEGVANPYYGFFVNRVPIELLSSFQASFRLDCDSSCRIAAEKDRVSIESSSLTDMFTALTQVLSLKAIPQGAKK